MKKLDQSGQGLTEYIILVFLIAIVSIAATKTFGNAIKSNISQATRRINSALTLDQ